MTLPNFETSGLDTWITWRSGFWLIVETARQTLAIR